MNDVFNENTTMVFCKRIKSTWDMVTNEFTGKTYYAWIQKKRYTACLCVYTQEKNLSCMNSKEKLCCTFVCLCEHTQELCALIEKGDTLNSQTAGIGTPKLVVFWLVYDLLLHRNNLRIWLDGEKDNQSWNQLQNCHLSN